MPQIEGEMSKDNLQKSTDERTPVWVKAFLSVLSKRGNVSDACRHARVHRTTVYARKEISPEFAAAWNEALVEASDALEAEAWRRAVDGVSKPVYQQKEMVGEVIEYSDTLLTLLLKANLPQKYKERVDHTSGDKPIKGYIGLSPDDWDKAEVKPE